MTVWLARRRGKSPRFASNRSRWRAADVTSAFDRTDHRPDRTNDAQMVGNSLESSALARLFTSPAMIGA